jgi:hypothetical protein
MKMSGLSRRGETGRGKERWRERGGGETRREGGERGEKGGREGGERGEGGEREGAERGQRQGERGALIASCNVKIGIPVKAHIPETA